MNKIKIFLLFGLWLLAAGCDRQQAPFVEPSLQGTVRVAGQDERVEVVVRSNTAWTVVSGAEWCTVEQNAQGFVASFGPNVGTEERSATLSVGADGATVERITIIQTPCTDYVFRIPVVAHVLYADSSNPNQNVRPGRIAELIEGANAYFARWNVGVRWVLATEDPKGRPTTEPGVDRIRWTGAWPIDAEAFSLDIKNHVYMWDPNQYLNVFFLEFDPSKSDALAFAYFPWVPDTHPLEGVDSVPSGRVELDDLDYLPGVFFDNKYVYADAQDIDQDDATQSLVHEMGHYLALEHVFDTDPNPGVCRDTDYCPDTKSYNRAAYEAYVGSDEVRNNWTREKLLSRTSCSGERFLSDNLMDYYYSWNNRFTPNQTARMRHALAYGLLIPGPKAIITPVAKGDRSAERLKGRRVE